jgi:hypothetical protein
MALQHNFHIRNKLSILDKAIQDHDSNIDDVNNMVISLCFSVVSCTLGMRKRTTFLSIYESDKGYAKTPNLVRHVKKKEDMEIERGSIRLEGKRH